MAENTDKKAPPANYPPPPPGPPKATGLPQQHPNETPLPEPTIPTYNPADPQYAAPPSDDADIYGATPTEDKLSPLAGAATHAQTQDAPATKVGWGQRLAEWGTKAAAPLNVLAAKVGSEQFLPTTLDKECEKAARILKNFCSKWSSLDRG